MHALFMVRQRAKHAKASMAVCTCAQVPQICPKHTHIYIVTSSGIHIQEFLA